MLIFTIAVAIMIFVDQWTKIWASGALKAAGSMDFIPHVVNLRYAENRGAAFSILQDKRVLLVVVTIAAIGVILYALKKGYVTHTLGRVGLTLICGGAIGNLIDRVFCGYVVDLFELAFIRFPIFNLADVFVSSGAVLFIIYMFCYFERDKREPDKEEAVLNGQESKPEEENAE